MTDTLAVRPSARAGSKSSSATSAASRKNRLAKVGRRIGELLHCDVPLVADWLDESTMTIRDHVAAAIRQSAPGSILLLENTRRYDDRARAVEGQARRPAEAGRAAGAVGQRVCRESRAASMSTRRCRPAASTLRARSCRRRWTAWRWASTWPTNSTGRCRAAWPTQLVVFSGLKIDKLDDLEAMIGRGTVKMVFTAGSLAMALKKADGRAGRRAVLAGPGRRPGPWRQAVLHSARAHRAGQAG